MYTNYMKNLRKTKLKTVALIIALTLIVTLSCVMMSGCLTQLGAEYFEDLLDQLAYQMLDGDALSINILISDPSALGLSKGQASLPLPTSKSEYEEGMRSLSTICDALLQVKYKSLSSRQKCDYDTLLNFFYTRSKYADYYYLQSGYLGSSNGWNTNLPIYLDKFELKDQTDVQNWLSLAGSAATAFPAYINFEQERITAGYGRASYIYEAIAEQARTMSQTENNSHFLIDIFTAKINACDFLNEERKTSAISQGTNTILNSLLPAYAALADSAALLVANETNPYGLAKYGQVGKDYYTLEFQNSASTSDSVSTAYANLIRAYNAVVSEIVALRLGAQSIVELKPDLSKSAVEGYYSTLINAYTEDFPALPASVPTATINSVPSQMSDYYSPASYFKSAIDNPFADENIYLNEGNASGYLGFDIISHEGLPGHQLQHAYYKTSGAHIIRSLIGYIGYSEGWASYAQYYSAKYFPGTDAEKISYQIECLTDKAITYLYTLIDIEVNYFGLTPDELAESGNYTEVFDEQILKTVLYEYIVEHPTVYASYGYGNYKMDKLRASYSGTDKAFHTAVLTIGPTTFELLEKFL